MTVIAEIENEKLPQSQILPGYRHRGPQQLRGMLSLPTGITLLGHDQTVLVTEFGPPEPGDANSFGVTEDEHRKAAIHRDAPSSSRRQPAYSARTRLSGDYQARSNDDTGFRIVFCRPRPQPHFREIGAACKEVWTAGLPANLPYRSRRAPQARLVMTSAPEKR